MDVNELVRMTDGYVGADIEAICREASIMALREMITPGMDQEKCRELSGNIVITMDHFDRALTRIRPTISRSKLQDYDKIAREFIQYATIGEKDDVDDKLKIYV